MNAPTALNPAHVSAPLLAFFTSRIAGCGRGQFTRVQHIGRKTGTTYETLMLKAQPRNEFRHLQC